MTTTTTTEVQRARAELVAPRFPVLDTLRAVGALAVLTTHVAFQAGDYGRHGTVGTLLARLDIGVAIFLVLSGFLLSRPFLARASLGLPRSSVRTYYLKRFWRIYPVYVVAVVVAMLAVAQDRVTGVRGWLVTLGLVNTFTDPVLPNGLTQMWSLAVEVCFYVVLPLVTLLATGRRALRPARVVLVLVAMTAVSVWWHLDGQARAGTWGHGSPAQWLPAYLAWFAAGIGLALVHVLHSTGRTGRVVEGVLALGRQPGVCCTIAGAALLAAATPIAGATGVIGPGPGEALTKNLLYAVTAALLVLAGVAAEPGSRFSRWLGAPLPRHLGLISYSIFCLHQVLIDVWARVFDLPLFGGYGVQLWLLTVASSLLVGEVAYRLVEVPGMRLRTLFSRRREARQSTTPTTGTTDW